MLEFVPARGVFALTKMPGSRDNSPRRGQTEDWAGLGRIGWTQVRSRARRLDVAKVQDAHPAPLGAPSFALLPPIALCPELPRSSSLPCLVVLTTGF